MVLISGAQRYVCAIHISPIKNLQHAVRRKIISRLDEGRVDVKLIVDLGHGGRYSVESWNFGIVLESRRVHDRSF